MSTAHARVSVVWLQLQRHCLIELLQEWRILLFVVYAPGVTKSLLEQHIHHLNDSRGVICPVRRETKEVQQTHCDGESASSDSSFEPMAEGNEESDSSFDFSASKLCCDDENELCDSDAEVEMLSELTTCLKGAVVVVVANVR